MADNEKQTYESAMKKLEEIVKKLESGQVSLDDSVKLYGEGTKLAAFCKGELDRAENTVKIYRAAPESTDGGGDD